MKELRQAWRRVKGPFWAGLNALRMSLKLDLLHTHALRKQRSKLGRKALVCLQRAHAVGWGVAAYVIVLLVALLLVVLAPISAALFVGGMYWQGVGE